MQIWKLVCRIRNWLQDLDPQYEVRNRFRKGSGTRSQVAYKLNFLPITMFIFAENGINCQVVNIKSHLKLAETALQSKVKHF